MKKIIGILIVILFALPVVLAQAGSYQWTRVTVETTNNIGANSHIEAVDANTLFIVYTDNTNDDIRAAISTNKGVSWNKVIVDAGSTAFTTETAVASATTWLAVYQSSGPGNPGDIVFAKTTNGGTSWATSVIEACAACRAPSIIAVDASTYYVTYIEDGDDIGFAYTSNGGSSWTLTTAIVGTYCFIGELANFDLDSFFVTIATGDVGCSGATGTGSVDVLQSNDAGLNWAATGVFAADRPMGSIGVTGTRGLIGFYDATAASAGNYRWARTVDGGLNWVVNSQFYTASGTVRGLSFRDVSDTYILGSFVDNSNYRFIQSEDTGDSFGTIETISELTSMQTENPWASGIGIMDFDEYAISSSDGTGADLQVYLSDLIAGGGGGGDPGDPGNVIENLIEFNSDAWGFDFSWIVGLVIIGFVVFGFSKVTKNGVILAIVATLGVGLCVAIEVFETWVLLIPIFIIIWGAGNRMFGGKAEDGE